MTSGSQPAIAAPSQIQPQTSPPLQLKPLHFLLAFPAAFFLPRFTLRRTDHLSLLKTTLFATFSIIIVTTLTALICFAYEFKVDEDLPLGLVAQCAGETVELLQVQIRSYLGLTLFAILYLLYCNLTAIPSAILTTIWSPQAGKLHHTFIHNLKRLQRLTPHLLLIFALHLLAVSYLDTAYRSYWEAYKSDGYEQPWEQLPWFLKERTLVKWYLTLFIFAYPPLILLVSLRIPAQHWHPRTLVGSFSRWPARCQTCGYPTFPNQPPNNDHCTECGKPLSLPVSNQCIGAPISTRPSIKSFFATLSLAIFAPIRRLSVILPNHRPVSGTGRYLLYANFLLIPINMIIFTVFFALMYALGHVGSSVSILDIFNPEVIAGFLTFQLITTLVFISLTLVLSLVTATIFTLKYKHNIFPLTSQLAIYLSPILIFTYLATGLAILFISFLLADMLAEFRNPTLWFFFYATFWLPPLAGIIFYLVKISRGISTSKHTLQ
ncbi:hypothetical protein [Poriferisphaera sp. WC338]|uniref:hypothetical protein n=1 Tax=Poriferisphaera sp. WC338 TaxID=3425129 RepID=UPI003D815385